MGDTEPEPYVLVTTTVWSGSEYEVAACTADGDVLRRMTRAEVHEHAEALLLAASRAEYDLAVYRQLTARGDPPDDAWAVQLLALVREQAWPPVREEATAPLRVRPGVNPDLQAFVSIEVEGKVAGTWTPDEMRQHAAWLLKFAGLAELDTAYRKFLIEEVGVEEKTAAVAVATVRHC